MKHGYIIDLDGTLYCGDTPRPFAGDFIRRLNDEGGRYILLTNSPVMSPLMIENKLLAMDIPVLHGKVVTSGTLAVDYLQSTHVGENPPRVNILGSAFLRQYAQDKLVLDREHPEYVLAAYDESLSMGEIRIACEQICAGARFIATNPDDSLPGCNGQTPHTGVVIFAIYQSTGVLPLIIGKPSGSLKQYLTEYFHCSAADIRVLGDRMDTDMQLARNCGFSAWLVLGGITTDSEAVLHPECYDRCFSDIGELYRQQIGGEGT